MWLLLLNTYNVFTTEAKETDSLAVKNRKIGELWRGLSIDEKEKYYMLAKEESTPGVGHCGDWKTVSKILSNMNTNVGFVSRWGSKVGARISYWTSKCSLSEHTFMHAFITCSANGLISVGSKCSMFSAMDQTIMLEERSVEFSTYSHMPTYQWTSSIPTKVPYTKVPYKSAL